MNEELKEMSLEELQELQRNIAEEIRRRQQKENLVLYTHDCKGCAQYHLTKYKHWAKLVSTVDTSKTNGYAFQGEFLNVREEHKLPANSIVVEVCSDNITAYRLEENGKVKIAEGKTSRMSLVIEEVAKIMEGR